MIDLQKFKSLGSVALISREGISRTAEVTALSRDEALVEGIEELIGGTLLKLQFQLPRRREEVVIEVRVVGDIGDGTPDSPRRTRMRFASATEDVMRDIERFLAPGEPAAADGEGAGADGARPAPATQLGPGAVVGRRYQITSALAPDSTFVNFEGVDRTTGHGVLVRALKPEEVEDGPLLDEFRSLHLSARAVQHPNVLRVLDYLRDFGRDIVVSELVRGPRLTQILEARGAFALDAIGRLSRQLLAGLAAVHARDMLYGVLHPGRVRIASGFNGKIADVALAQIMPLAYIAPDDDPISFAAPEVRLGAVPTERSEVYSFGMLLYALAVGGSPFGPEERAGLDVQPDLEPTPPGQSERPVPEALVPVIERAIAIDPAARFASLADLAFELHPVFQDAGRSKATQGRILVVEDDPSLRHMIVSVLRSSAHEVLTAENGIDALEVAFKEPLDLICLDIRMPRMDGFEVCMVLRADERTKQVPILVVSVANTNDNVTLMESLGASGFLPKPFEEQALLEQVAKLLKR